jgi:hypothetical protein
MTRPTHMSRFTCSPRNPQEAKATSGVLNDVMLPAFAMVVLPQALVVK